MTLELAATESLFWTAVTRGEVAPEAARLFTDSPTFSTDARLHVYADMYRFRLVDALRADFPKLAQLLGEDAFSSLAEAYLKAHPSQAPSIAHFGDSLSSFLRAHPGPRADLADLAELETQRNTVFFDEDPSPINADALRALGDSLPEAQVRLISALRLVTQNHDAAEIWSALESGKPAPSTAARQTHVVIWRQGFDVFHTSINAAEAESVGRAIGGCAFAALCEPFADAPSAFAAISAWAEDGWISTCSPQRPTVGRRSTRNKRGSAQ